MSRQLLYASADANSKTIGGSAALHCAIVGNHLEIAWLLLKAGTEKNSSRADSATPLHLAVRSGKLVIVKLLLDAGAEKISAAWTGLVHDHAVDFSAKSWHLHTFACCMSLWYPLVMLR